MLKKSKKKTKAKKKKITVNKVCQVIANIGLIILAISIIVMIVLGVMISSESNLYKRMELTDTMLYLIMFVVADIEITLLGIRNSYGE